MRYQKIPVVIEAVLFNGVETVDDVPEPMFDGSFDPPAWIIDGLAKAESEEGAIWTGSRSVEPDVQGLFIHTLEGDHFAMPGDMIIRGVKGELYPCKPDIFNATYDVEGAQPEGRIVGGIHMAPRFDFGLAIHALRSGERVARAGWNGKGIFLFLVPGSRFSVNRPPLLGIYPEGTMIDYRPHIDIRGTDGGVSTWAPSIGDALAEDWEIVEAIGSDAPKYIELAPHMQRVAVERDDLADKLEKLKIFIDGPTFSNLDEVAQGDLVDQQAHMAAYLYRLEARLSR